MNTKAFSPGVLSRARKPYIRAHVHMFRHTLPLCGVVGQFGGRESSVYTENERSPPKVDYADYRTNLIKDCHINNLHLPHCQVRELRE